MTIAVRIIPTGDEIQYVRYELDWLLKLLRLSQEWLQILRKAGLLRDYGIYCIYNNNLEVTAMLKTPELAMPRTNKVTTVCNGKREVWTDYEQAKAYFLELMMSTDGEEHERAECVYIQLLHGLDKCSDVDE
jgi:hypothetical protein